MKIKFCHNNVRMLFDVSENGFLNLRYVGTEDREPSEYGSQRSAVELGSHPGFGNWEKKIATEAGSLRYVSHRDTRLADGWLLEFELKDARFLVTLHYRFYNGADGFRTWTSVKNISEKTEGLSYVSSFHYNGFEKKDCGDIMICHNGWCQEVMPVFYRPIELGLSQVQGVTSKKILVGNTGTFSNKDYLPIGYMNGMFWQIDHSGSWRWEVSDNASNLYVALAGPTDENCFYKKLAPGDTFESVRCSVSFGSDFQLAFEGMNILRRKIKGCHAGMEKQPLIFNDFMHCLVTNPRTAICKEMIDWAAKAGAEYYCMDAGWYADGGWWDSVGQWQVAKNRFDNGLGEIFDYARSKGLTPGIWLEPEVMGINCPLVPSFPEECFFHRNGQRVVYRQRYQLDYRHPKVLEHMNETVERLIRDFGIGYFKFDYNIDAGVGTDVASDSLGDGLMQYTEAFLAWVDGIRARHPDVLIENCASGGMRMNYGMLQHFDLQSTSDQESFLHTAPIASNAALGVLPEQAGVWVCPLKGMEANKLVYTIVNGMTGSFYLAGRPNEQGENFALLAEGVEVWKSYRDQIKTFRAFWPLGFNRFDDNRHCVAYRADDGRIYLFLWQNEAVGDIALPIAAKSCQCVYPKKNGYTVSVGEDTLTVNLGGELTAGVFVIEP